MRHLAYGIYIVIGISMASVKFVGQVLFAIDALPGSDESGLKLRFILNMMPIACPLFLTPGDAVHVLSA